MPSRRRLVLFVLLCGSLLVGKVRGDNWLQWRGERHDGLSREPHVPVRFRKDENLAWRLPLPTRAGSPPVGSNQRIFLTSPAEDNDALLLLCVSTAGKELWRKEIGKGNRNVRD